MTALQAYWWEGLTGEAMFSLFTRRGALLDLIFVAVATGIRYLIVPRRFS